MILCLLFCPSAPQLGPPSAIICHPGFPWGFDHPALHSALCGASGSPAGTRWRSETWRWHSSTSGWGGVEGGAGAEGRAAGWEPGKPEPRASPRPWVGPAGSGLSVSLGPSARGRQAEDTGVRRTIAPGILSLGRGRGRGGGRHGVALGARTGQVWRRCCR